jgi:DNA-binding CsgD family transcriptional regulator
MVMKNISNFSNLLACPFQPAQELIKFRCDWIPHMIEDIPVDAQHKYIEAIRLLVVPCKVSTPYLLDLREGTFCRFAQHKKTIAADSIIDEPPFYMLFDTILKKTEEIITDESILDYFSCVLPSTFSENIHSYNITLKSLERTSKNRVWLFLVQIGVSYHCEYNHELLFYHSNNNTVEYYHWASGRWSFEERLELTFIEKEIIRYSLAGLNSKEIAQQTCYKENSINTYRCNLLEKLHVHNICEAIAKCQKYNLLKD